MLNEFPELAGNAAAAAAGAGLLTAAQNSAAANVNASKAHKFLNGHHHHHQRELAHIAEFCPEWAWSDVSRRLPSEEGFQTTRNARPLLAGRGYGKRGRRRRTVVLPLLLILAFQILSLSFHLAAAPVSSPIPSGDSHGVLSCFMRHRIPFLNQRMRS